MVGCDKKEEQTSLAEESNINETLTSQDMKS
jgi:hypothetical protein